MERDEKQRLTAILRAILATALVGGSILFLGGLLTGSWVQISATTIVVAISLGLLGLTQRGYLAIPRIALPAVGLAIATYTAVMSNGLHDEGVFIYPAVIVGAGLLLGRRGIVSFAALSIAATTGIACAEMAGWLVTNYSADVTWAGVLIVNTLLAAMAALLYITIDHLTHSLEQTRRSERELLGAQEALRQERDTAQLYLDVAGVIMVALDADGRVTLINRKGCTSLGYGLDEIIGKNWFDTFLPECDRETTRAVFRELMSGKLGPSDEYFENRVLTQTGQERLVAWRNTLLKDPSGRVIGTFSSGEDITERVQARQELKESEERYRTLIQNQGEGIGIVDPQERFTFANPAAESIFGVPSGELVGRNLHEFVPPEEFAQLRAQTQSRQQGGKSTYETEIIQPNGARRTILVTATPRFDAAGQFAGSFGVFRDVTMQVWAGTALRASEARYRRLVDNAPIGILSVDAEGQVVDTNPKMLDILGLPSAETARAINVLTFPPLVEAGLTADLRHCLKTGESSATERFYQTGWGKAVHVRVRATPIKETNDAIVGVQAVIEDISDRKQIEAQRETALAELQQAKRRLDDIIDFLPEATFVIDHEGRVIAWNRAIETMTGVSKSDMMGRGDQAYSVPFYGEKRPILIDLVFLPSSALEEKRYQHIQRSGDTLFAEAYVPGTYQGRGAYLWGTASLLRDASGEIVGAIESIHDITGRQQMENALRDSQTQLAEALEMARLVYWEYDVRAGHFVLDDRFHAYWNPGAEHERSYHLPASEFAARYVHPDDVHLMYADIRNALAADDVKYVSSTEARLRRADGEIRHVVVRSKIVQDEQGRTIKLHGTIQDITELKQAEQALRQANAELSARLQELAMLNRIGATISAGLDVAQVLQSLYEQWQQVVKPDRFYVALYDAATELIHFPLFCRDEKPVQVASRPLRTQPGITGMVILARQTIYVPDTLDSNDPRSAAIIRVDDTPTRSYLGVPLLVRQKVIGVLSIQSYEPHAYTPEQIGLLETVAAQAAIAIENARLYTQARHAQETAEAASRAKSVFLANMSHELRTPLNAVLGFTQLMTNAPNLTDEQHENLGIVGRSGEHLLALINDVLEISKIESGRVELRAESFDLHHLLRGIEEMFRLRAAQKGLTLTFELDPAVPQYIHADGGKLRQVLINLLGNAVKFTPQGGVTLRVKSQAYAAGSLPESDAVSPAARVVLFEIEDTGAGIASEEIDKLFNAFVQTASGRSAGEGTGLGLPISHQYVRMMGGELRVRSTLGQGSCFSFDIPLAPAGRAASPPARGAPAIRQVVGLEPGQHAPEGGPYRLLVVEDVEASRKLLITLLRSWRPASDAEEYGLEIREAANGQAAVALWEQWRPHLIWMDIRMPGMDGYEATKQIRARAKAQAPATAPSSPIIVALTAGAFEEERERILAEGCDDFVRKPFHQADICAVLKRHLDLRFVYEETPGALSGAAKLAGEAGLEPAALQAALRERPAAWQAELRQASIEGDGEWLTKLAEQVRAQDVRLAEQLLEWIGAFQYQRILDLFESIER